MLAPSALVAAKFRREPSGGYLYHPLICHMVDVAAVAEALWDDCLPRPVQERFCEEWALDAGSTRAWIAFLAGAHDLGKATPAFQAKASSDRRSTPDWLADTTLAFGTLRITDAPEHGVVTASTLPQHLRERLALADSVARRLSVITGGHHGKFSTAADRKNVIASRLGEPRTGQLNPWLPVRAELASQLSGLLGVSGTPAEISNASSLVLAGIISVVDWIGSIDDDAFFPYCPDGPADLPNYLAARRSRAEAALAALHWKAWPTRNDLPPFKDLFEFPPRPLQQVTESLIHEVAAPGLAIIEAPMGEGKTEAAFYLAEHWNTLGYRGCYIAMPTQATSNQLYDRFKRFLQHRFATGEEVNLQLLHGHAALNAEIDLLEQGLIPPPPSAIDADEGDATVGAGEWFTHRKRGLLAPFGVGTIDQALLAVLQVKHGFVRIYGLAGKAIIVDEVHAYDTYMTSLLERLLEWLAAIGSPVVLLSATLPAARRHALMNAYLKGRGQPAKSLPQEAYPRITLTTDSGQVGAVTIETSAATRRTLALRWLPFGFEDLPTHLLGQLRSGGCAAVVCNTVNRAQAVYMALRDAYATLPVEERPELDLFHARFLFKDRQEREARCLRQFGKPDEPGGATPDRPRRSILVATQVIEQSLDLDFDLMVSEIAPVDLLLQRSGRLHRHWRSDRSYIGPPELQLLVPQIDADDLPVFERATTYVYDEHILLRTWLTLRGRESIAIPEDVEPLVEAVYAEGAEPPFGSSARLLARWTNTFKALEIKTNGLAALANQPLIPPANPSADFPEEEFFEVRSSQLLEDRPDAAPERQARARYEQLPSVQVIWLDSRQAERARTRTLDRNRLRELLLQSVSLHGWWASKLYAQEFPPAWRENSLLRHYRLLSVDNGHIQVPGAPELSLDTNLGLVIRFQAVPAVEEVQAD